MTIVFVLEAPKSSGIWEMSGTSCIYLCLFLTTRSFFIMAVILLITLLPVSVNIIQHILTSSFRKWFLCGDETNTHRLQPDTHTPAPLWKGNTGLDYHENDIPNYACQTVFPVRLLQLEAWRFWLTHYSLCQTLWAPMFFRSSTCVGVCVCL